MNENEERSVVKSVSLPKAYDRKIQAIKKFYGITNDSEVIRRAIDCLFEKISLKEGI